MLKGHGKEKWDILCIFFWGRGKDAETFWKKEKKNKAQEFGIDVEDVSEAAAELILSSVNPLKAYHSIPRGTTCNGKYLLPSLRLNIFVLYRAGTINKQLTGRIMDQGRDRIRDGVLLVERGLT